MLSGRPTDLIQSVSRALRILEEVGDSPEGLNAKQIAHRCDIALPTTYHLVRTLTYEGQLSHEIAISARFGVFTEQEQYRPEVCCAAVLLDQGRTGAIGISSSAGLWPQLNRALVAQLTTRASDLA